MSPYSTEKIIRTRTNSLQLLIQTNRVCNQHSIAWRLLTAVSRTVHMSLSVIDLYSAVMKHVY